MAMNVILFDDAMSDNLLPFTFTRPVAAIRIGVYTLAEKWEAHLGASISYKTKDYLQTKFNLKQEESNLWINGACIASPLLAKKVGRLKENQSLTSLGGRLVAVCSAELSDDVSSYETIEVEADFINYPEDIFGKNGAEIENDMDVITHKRESQPISGSNTVIGEGRIFIEPTAKVEGAILNASSGSIYVGENAEIMEGSLVRGGLALCNNAALKLGTKIYGPTTIGPHSKVGGEVNNSVLIGYSNKGHDGFLGNSVLGEWCNIGADSNNSNLKNNYAEVRLWDYTTKRFRKTGKQFCGLMMGDHSKCGINTMFNTGTVVGVSSNLFGSGFPRNYVPSFAWGGASGYSTYQLKKAFETAELVLSRRDKEFDQVEKDIISEVFSRTAENRFWENT